MIIPTWTQGATAGPGLEVTSPSATAVPFSVRGLSTDAPNKRLTEWRMENGGPLFGIRADGQITTAKAVPVPAGSTLRNLVGYLLIYNFSNAHAYIPLYDGFNSPP